MALEGVRFGPQIYGGDEFYGHIFLYNTEFGLEDWPVREDFC